MQESLLALQLFYFFKSISLLLMSFFNLYAV